MPLCHPTETIFKQEIQTVALFAISKPWIYIVYTNNGCAVLECNLISHCKVEGSIYSSLWYVDTTESALLPNTTFTNNSLELYNQW